MTLEEEKSDLSLPLRRPDPEIAESKKDERWFKQNVRYFSSFYNTIPPQYAEDNPLENLTPVDKGIKYSLYYLGKQQNIDYNHLTQDLSGNTLQAVWVKGKKVKTLMDHLLGNILTHQENKELTSKTLSDKVTNKKTRMYDELMLKHDTDALRIFQGLAQLGVEFNPAGSKQFESQEAIERFIEYDWKENSEVYMVDIARAIEEDNDVTSMYLSAFIDYCAANYTAVHTYAKHKRIIQEKVPFYNLIWDVQDGDPFNRKMKFVGKIERLTPEEVFSKWDFTNSEKEELKEMASAFTAAPMSNEFTFLNNHPSIDWIETRQGQPLLSAVTMFWIGPTDTRYQNSKDKYGNNHVKKAKKDGDKSDYIIQDVYMATLVANRYVKDWGYMTNVVRPPGKKDMPELPIKVFSGMQILGDGVSPIGMIAQEQDRIDALRWKIMEKIGKDAGKSYIVYGDKLQSGVTTAPSIIQDLKTMGISVITGSNGESTDPNQNRRLIETVDLSLDGSVVSYINLCHESERIMEEAMNIPKIALGQQQTYTGLGTQRGTIAQSTLGLAMMYRNFTKFNEINISYAANVAKIACTNDGDYDASFVIGDRGVKMMKITKDMRFEDLLIFIKARDVIDAEARQRLLSYAQAWSQNPAFGVDPVDILKMEQAKSYTELINDFEFSLKQKQRKQAQQQQMMMQAEQQAEQQAINADMQKTAMKEDGANQRAALGAEAQLAGKMIGANQTKGMPIQK